jgi:hypothetical protein
MATQTDFWGEIGVIGDRTPLSILREQAALLGTKTQNLVEAAVESRGVNDEFSHSFHLVVPVLDHYKYELFSIRHPVVDMYPVTVGYVHMYPVLAKGNEKRLRNEDEFKEWLSKTLSSPETKKILGNLIAQARS